MPKVSPEYMKKKKKRIIDATYNVFQHKPLYGISMLDIVREAELSKGGIYRYYKDVDEVLIAMINRESAKHPYKDSIDDMLRDTDNSDDTIKAILVFLGAYIQKHILVLGKIQFELTVLLANHPEKTEKYMHQLVEQNNSQYLMKMLHDCIKKGIEDGIYTPSYSVQDLYTYISTFINGLIRDMVLSKCYGAYDGKIDAVQMMGIFAQSLLGMLKTTSLRKN